MPVGSSEKSMENAVRKAIARADRTLDDLGWFEVIETRGKIECGKVASWQVILKAGFTLRDS